MSQSILLSLCIPTYNFGRFIGETLESILQQILGRCDVEIVVVDGNSQDNTAELMQSYCTTYPDSIRYFRLPERGGIDKDMALSISYARGKYCWLFSSDDVLLPDSIEKILHEIQEDWDVYLVNFSHYNLDLTKKIYDIHPLSKLTQDKVIDFSNAKERGDYFIQANETCALFSFMSCLILKKSKWDAVKENPQFMGSCWAHVARLFELIPYGFKLKYLADPYLIKRAENDSFMEHGIIQRVALGVEGWLNLAKSYFAPNSIEYKSICRLIKNEFPYRSFFHFYSMCLFQERNRLRKLAFKVHGFPLRIVFLFSPRILHGIRRIYAFLKRRVVIGIRDYYN